MSKSILSHNKNGDFSGMVSQSITINASSSILWEEIGNFIGLSDWVMDVKKRWKELDVKRTSIPLSKGELFVFRA